MHCVNIQVYDYCSVIGLLWEQSIKFNIYVHLKKKEPTLELLENG